MKPSPILPGHVLTAGQVNGGSYRGTLALPTVRTGYAASSERKSPTDPGFLQGRLDCGLYICGLLALGASSHVKGDLLVLGERFEAWGLDCWEVDEKVVAAVIVRDKSIAFRVVKPFNSTSCHVGYS
jgi:hypothetical protein